jgi:hypothetical protein
MEVRMKRFAVLLAISLAAFAQSDRGTITGTISDPAGAVIPSASVVAVQPQTGAQYQTVTTATGNYTLASLPAGVYNLTVEGAGFKKFIQTGITVQVAQTARVDITLEVGSLSQSVTVDADAPLLRTESAEQSTTVTSEVINALPLNFGSAFGQTNTAGNVRNPLAFASLAPGTSNVAGSNTMIRVNGAPNSTYKVMFEGQDTTSTIDSSHFNEMQPSVEALQEFTLQTSNYAAEFGQVAGGLFNLTAKSGSNAIHGSGYEYFTNELLNSGIPFTDNGSGRHVKSRDRRNDFGTSLGGPVYLPKLYNGRDKTFFFFSVEFYRNKRVDSGTFATVPTDAMRRGDFSAILTGKSLGTDTQGRSILENTLYDPNTNRLLNGAVVRDPFPGNVIPQTRFDPVAAKIQALIPAATRAGLTNNFAQVVPNPRIQNIPSVKADHSFSANSKASLYWSRYSSDATSGSDGMPAPLTGLRMRYLRTTTARINYDATLSPTFLVHAGIGYVRYNNPDIAVKEEWNYDAVGQLGLVGGINNPAGFPRLTGLTSSYGGYSLNMGPSNGNNYFNDKPTALVSATMVRGNHTFKAGADWHVDIWTDRNTAGTTGNYAFSAVETSLPSTQGQSLSGGTIGFPYASFLLGAVDTASIGSGQDPQLRKTSWSMFAQDTWKVTRKLTVDYGVRWDYQQAPHELYNRLAVFAPSLANPSAGGLPGATLYASRCNCSLTPEYPFAIGPRLGVAYQINSKTVLRAGWGLTYGATTPFNYLTGTSIVGVGWNTLNFSTATYGDPAALLRTGLSYNRANLYSASYDNGIRPSLGQTDSPPYYLDRNGGRPPRILQWSIGLQREISRDLVLEASYIGNRGVWLTANSLVSLNALTPERLKAFGLDINNAADRSVLTSRLNSATAISRGFGKAPYSTFALTNTVAQSLRPYPQFGDIGVQWAPLGNSWYDALQMKATKRYSHGLVTTASFTWQKELTDAEAAAVNDVFNRPVQKTLSGSSKPFIISIGFDYQVPALGPSRWTKAVIGGWTFGGVMQYSSGLPIPVPAAQNALSGLLFRGTNSNRVAGQPLFTADLNCHCYDPSKDFLLNPKAWSDPAAGQWGTAAAFYNDYRYQRRPNEQLSFGRRFRVREGMNLQVRAELFNPFNRVFLNNPTATNALATQARNAQGQTTSGFGYISTGSLYSTPRTAQLMARFVF